MKSWFRKQKRFRVHSIARKASVANVQIAKSGYYPSISIIGGYTALNLQNIITVQNAMNMGVSYDLSGILKNGTNVKIAESKALEVQNSEMMLTDDIKIQVQKAIEDYDLALKQDLVYNQAVEQASENYRIIKDTITVYLTPMIFLKLMWNNWVQISTKHWQG
jgi:outer membrane protein TolC